MIATTAHRDVFLTIGGLRLHHVDHGGDGPPILLLHGVTGHAAVWHGVAPRLVDAGQVRALDLRGFGDSQWSADGSYRTRDHAGDVVAILDDLGIDRATLVGSSWGALVSVAVASVAPERVERLVLVDVEPSFEQRETDLFARPREFATHEDAVAHERASNPHAPAELLDVVVAQGTRPAQAGTLVPKHDPFFFERWPFRSDDWWSALAEITAPTLVVHAGESFVRRDVTEKMAATLRAGTHVGIAHSTHVVPIDAPEPLASLLLDFLR
jgi:pimeloyl-ACP methyl ester carboxylesterase